MRSKIITKIGLTLLFMSSLIFVVSIVDRVFYTRITAATSDLSESILPRAILSLSILDEIGDMNANILEYLSGEEEEKEDFTSNLMELRGMLDKMKALPGADKAKLREIDMLVKQYEKRAREEVFAIYDPRKEKEAIRSVRRLSEKTGFPLENLLDEFKASEIADAGSVPDLQKVLEDDLPGVQYYLELVDEAGDMISDLNAYITSENPENERNSFDIDALSFKEFLSKLRPIEQDEAGVNDLNKVELLFTTLYTSGIEIMNSYDPLTKKKALEAIDDLEHDIFRDLETILDAYSNSATTDSRAQIEKLLKITRFNEQVIWGVLIMVFIVGVGITYFTYSTVLKPINQLNKNILDLSEGEKDIEIFGLNRQDEIGELANAVLKFKESTDMRSRMERQLLEEKTKAEEATRYKSDFLANMSHEIRTPMNAITGLLTLVLKTDLNNKQYGYLLKINTAAKNLLGILNDILDFSKIEAGKLTIEQSRFNLNEVLQNISLFLMEKNEEKELELIYNIAPEVPFELSGDSLRLGQVLLNLTSNSMKFTSRGELVLSISVSSRKEDTVYLSFEVQDTGIGIEPEVLRTIFQPFVQADHSHTRRFGGTGLGLAITRQLVELMGGELTVKSDVGMGTVFSFTLPFKTYGVEEQFITDNINEMAGQKILVADSNERSRDVAGRLLDSLKMVPRVVGEGRAAVDLFHDAVSHDNPYDIVMLDWNLQDISCIDAAEQILSNAGDTDPSLLFSCSSSRETVLERLESFENDGLIQKPYSRSTLFDSIVEALGKENLIQEYNRIKVHEDSNSLDSFAGSRILVAEDNEINREVVHELLVDLGMTVALVSDGEKAVEYLQSKNKVDLVLMDIQMPRMDGLEATKAIRKLSHRKELPIIALTAHALLSQKKQCIEVGMNDHISKPIEHRELVKKLTKWLPLQSSGKLPKKESRHDQEESGGNNSSMDIDALEEIPNISAREAIERFGGSADLFKKVLKRFAGPNGMDIISQLEYAVKHHDLESIRHTAHALKGAAGTVGAMQLFKTASEIEDHFIEDEVGYATIKSAVAQYHEISKAVEKLLDESDVSLETSIDNDQFENHLNKIIALVRERDVESLNFFTKYLDENFIPSDTYKDIEISLEEYEFEKALNLLLTVKRKLNEGDIS